MAAEAKDFLGVVPDAVRIFFHYTAWIWSFTQADKYQEILGVCSVLEPQYSTSDCVLVNTLYELEAYCTSVIAKKEDNSIIHGRVMDFDFSDDMRNGTYNAHFVKGGKPVFDAVMFAGTVGVYTGVKYGGFGITLNERT